MNHSVKYVLLAVAISSCSDPMNQGNNSPGSNPGDATWSIPKSEVLDGGPGKDGIPALENPFMISSNQTEYLADDALVVGFKNGTDARAYPHAILDWHEIINDKVGDVAIAIIYCPLTGTATGWSREINGVVTTFGVSGLLYNSNVIPYDRLTNSNWSQMRLDCVNGVLKGQKAITYHLVETTWKTWKAMYPQTKIVSTSTGYARSYGTYPYGDYITNNNQFLFPYKKLPESELIKTDHFIPNKERVLGLISDLQAGDSKVYRFKDFDSELKVINTQFRETNLVIAGSKINNFMVAFESKLADGTNLTFTAASFSKGITDKILIDQEGNSWNIFGEAISGPRQGQRLKSALSFMGYWFVWGSFYPSIEFF